MLEGKVGHSLLTWLGQKDSYSSEYWEVSSAGTFSHFYPFLKQSGLSCLKSVTFHIFASLRPELLKKGSWQQRVSWSIEERASDWGPKGKGLNLQFLSSNFMILSIRNEFNT